MLDLRNQSARYQIKFLLKITYALSATWFVYVLFFGSFSDKHDMFQEKSIGSDGGNLGNSEKINKEAERWSKDSFFEALKKKLHLDRLQKMKAKPPGPPSGSAELAKPDKVKESGKCEVFQSAAFPECQNHFEWMKKHWKTDPCFSTWDVDGSDCSIWIYLSEVENWCHPLPGRSLTVDVVTNSTGRINQQTLAPVSDFKQLYDAMGDDVKYTWMKQRIMSSESRWISSADKLFTEQPSIKLSKKKTILIQMGLLFGKPGQDMAKNALKGISPLGELVQWADLIASLSALGHDLHLSVDLSLSINRLMFARETFSFCPSAKLKKVNSPVEFDLIYTDIHGIRALQSSLHQKQLDKLRCKYRVVDSFGTQAAFNNLEYANRKSLNTHWSGFDLNLQQFNTMFPHTHDNTFLGFVSERPDRDPTVDIKKENIAVVYGKQDKYWKEKSAYIDEISKLISVHGTFEPVKKWVHAPKYVTNHGVLKGSELVQLLQRAKIFVGLGFPYEGPGPLEAIGNGAVYINPIINKSSSESKTVDEIFKDKPTWRRPTSQNPYCEKYIGHPYVQNVDMKNLSQVRSAVEEVLNGEQISPFLPYEYTYMGMLERLAVLVEMQDFCTSDHRWPPLSSFKTVISTKDESCEEACEREELRCDGSFFDVVNRKETFQQAGIECVSFVTFPSDQQEIDHPSFNGETCYLQTNPQLFSCSGRFTNHQHLCPCRDYIRQQVALCKSCRPLSEGFSYQFFKRP